MRAMTGGSRRAEQLLDLICAVSAVLRRAAPGASAAASPARCRRRRWTMPSTTRVVQPACSSAARQRAGARADLVGAHPQHPLHRHAVSAADRVLLERGLERGVGQLVDAQRAHQRMTADPLERAARRPAMIPACGPPSSLSPLKHTTSTPGVELSETTGSSRSGPRCRLLSGHPSQPLPRSSATGTLSACRSRPARRAPDVL